jgi:phenylacetate-CoA ligase
MVLALGKYLFSLHYWNSASLDSLKSMQLKKFRKVFEHARKHSKFYKEYYGDHGVLDLEIASYDDIKKVPIINKSILKKYSAREIMTRAIDVKINIHSTSGSSGEPFQIAFNKFEDYTAHVRVFYALRKAGYKLTDDIVLVTRYESLDHFAIEKDLSFIGTIQKKLKLFQREIISIYEPVDDIIAKLLKTKARILWSTPSIMQIVANRLKEIKIKLDFPIIFFTSEVISARQKGLFVSYLGKKIVDVYGSMESPCLGFDIGLKEKFAIFPNSNLFEFIDADTNDAIEHGISKIVITNLLNKTMPFVRFDLNDLTELDNAPEWGCKYIKRIIGRQDDILKLKNGKELAHHHAYEMFKDFHECEMYKFIQKQDKTVLLQLKISRDQDKSHVEKLAYARWRSRFHEVPLLVEFVNSFKINPQTGKFKNIEIEN